MMDEIDWDVVTDLALKAADDAMAAMARSVFLGRNAMESVIISLVAYAVVQAEHEAVKEAMAESPGISSAIKMADGVYAAIKANKAAKLKVTLPLVREALKRMDKGGLKVG